MNWCKCKKCDYEWKPRRPNPKACPDCKSRTWKSPATADCEVDSVIHKLRRASEYLPNEIRSHYVNTLSVSDIPYGYKIDKFGDTVEDANEQAVIKIVRKLVDTGMRPDSILSTLSGVKNGK